MRNRLHTVINGPIFRGLATPARGQFRETPLMAKWVTARRNGAGVMTVILKKLTGWREFWICGDQESDAKLAKVVVAAGSSPAFARSKIHVAARWIDARYGNNPRTTSERSTTLIEDLEAKGMIFLAAPSEKRIDGGRPEAMAACA